MRLIDGTGRRRKSFVRQDCLEALRDVGSRLETLVTRYETLVNELGRSAGPVADFTGRVDMVNGQLAYVTRRLQELFLMEHDARLVALAEEQDIEEARQVYPRSAAPVSA